MVAASLALGWGAYSAWYEMTNDYRGGDFRHVWLAARAVIEGLDPYTAVTRWETAAGHGPGNPGFYYPMPSVLLGLPLAALPAEAAAVVAFTVFTGIAAYVATRERWTTLACFAGPSMVECARNAQVTPLILAAMFAPPAFAVVFAVLKPTTGAAAWFWRPTPAATRWAVVGGGALCLLGLLIAPRWPAEWVQTGLRGNYARSAVLTAWFGPVWFGPVLLLAALRWRRTEARLLLGLSCVPHTLFWADEMLLGVVPRTWREAFYGTMASHLVYQMWAVEQHLRHPGFRVAWEGVPWSIAALYLPPLFLILRRPNAGDVPAWLERAVSAVSVGATANGVRSQETR
jgi:hypothetical protein